MSLQAFLKNNADVLQETEVVISDRFIDDKGNKVPFRIKPITSKETEEIRKKSFKIMPNGKMNFDHLKYQNSVAAACVTYPDLKSEELQQSYGVYGEGELLESMLLVGEYQLLISKIDQINGFKNFAELVDEAKN